MSGHAIDCGICGARYKNALKATLEAAKQIEDDLKNHALQQQPLPAWCPAKILISISWPARRSLSAGRLGPMFQGTTFP